MPSTLHRALVELRDILLGIDGGGAYNLDVRGRVSIGPATQSPAGLGLFLRVTELPRTLETTLGRYRQYLPVVVEGVVGAGYGTTEARTLAALDLAADVAYAIDTHRTLRSTVLDARVTGAEVVEVDGQVWGCRVLVEAWYHPTQGA